MLRTLINQYKLQMMEPVMGYKLVPIWSTALHHTVRMDFTQKKKEHYFVQQVSYITKVVIEGRGCNMHK